MKSASKNRRTKDGASILVATRQPENALAHWDLAVVLANQTRLDDSLLELKEVLRLQPDNQSASNLLSQIQAQRDRQLSEMPGGPTPKF